MKNNYFTSTLKDGEPCSHPGCLNHVTHPCEGCGRIRGKSPDYFTTTLLPMHIKLQGLYRRVMGDWQYGDRFADDDGEHIIVGISKVIYRAGTTGERTMLEYDIYNIGLNEILCSTQDYLDDECVRIPRTIDDSSPEASKRSLIEMLDDAGRHTIEKDIDRYILNIEDREPWYEGVTPTECILKALIAQEGIEP